MTSKRLLSSESSSDNFEVSMPISSSSQTNSEGANGVPCSFALTNGIANFLWQSLHLYRLTIPRELYRNPHRAISGDEQYLHFRRVSSICSSGSLEVVRSS